MRNITLNNIIDTVEKQLSGQKEIAKQEFLDIINQGLSDPLHICIVGHYFADLQENKKDELSWDLKSLEALEKLSDERLKEYHSSLSKEEFYPSICLNIADDYFCLNDNGKAEFYIKIADATSANLPENGYRTMIKNGIKRLKEKLNIID